MKTSIITLREANAAAKTLGLVRGKGAYNGAAFWTRPGENAIITRQQIAEMIGRV